MDAFEWTDAPLSSLNAVAATSCAYVVLALLAKRRCAAAARRSFLGGEDARVVPGDGVIDSDAATVKERYAAFQKLCDARIRTGPSSALALHSALLCVASCAMFVGASRAVADRAAAEGWSFFFCETAPGAAAAGPVYFWAYAYYLSKYYELLDTFLPVLVHGRVPRHFAMHVFHHAAVLFMAYGYLECKQTLAFGGLIANAGTHVVMYAYYALAAARLPAAAALKPWVTRLQILQFASSFLLVLVAAARRDLRECAGAGALLANVAFNAILLVLFFGVLSASNAARKEVEEEKKKKGE